MLTRLKVSGFKNLVDVDVRFGAFTCIAGSNAVGKSNLFDAIHFLGHLSEKTFLEAALAIRSDEQDSDIRSIVQRIGDVYAECMSFEAGMLIPTQGEDELGQILEASATLVRYTVKLRYRTEWQLPLTSPFELVEETLEAIGLENAAEFLKFPYDSDQWLPSVSRGGQAKSLISTKRNNRQSTIHVNTNELTGERQRLDASGLPRTVLSTHYTASNPTALIVRKEMSSWMLLQFETSALRRPDRFATLATPGLLANGAHLPATLYHLAHVDAFNGVSTEGLHESPIIYSQIAGRLSELINGVQAIQIDRDEARQLLTLHLMEKDRISYPAHSLSDGTLRFLALSVIEMDPSVRGLICIEEPETGIHPSRIPAMLRLLQDIACDTTFPVDEDNPLRQVIINTHSPFVVSQVPDDSLLVALPIERIENGNRFQGVRFEWLADTWRTATSSEIRPIARGKLLDYLTFKAEKDADMTSRRVMDRDDLQFIF
ncbi:MAG: AAA family ATPase [Chloroflexota bacterium]